MDEIQPHVPRGWGSPEFFKAVEVAGPSTLCNTCVDIGNSGTGDFEVADICGGVSGMHIWVNTPGKTQDSVERLYLSTGLGTSWYSPGGVGGSDPGKKYLDLRLLCVSHATQTGGNLNIMRQVYWQVLDSCNNL